MSSGLRRRKLTQGGGAGRRGVEVVAVGEDVCKLGVETWGLERKERRRSLILSSCSLAS